jgi:hypothetical protein
MTAPNEGLMPAPFAWIASRDPSLGGAQDGRSTISDVSDTMVSDRRASWQEVAARRAELRARAIACGLTDPRLRDDGAVIVHAPDAGYLSTSRFAAEAAEVVGTYVHVLTDDVPAAAGSAAQPL